MILSQFSAALALGSGVKICRSIGTHCSRGPRRTLLSYFRVTREDETMHRGILENLRPLSFGRETHVPCVGPARPPESEHSGPSWASQGSDWTPLRGHIIHLVLWGKSPCEVAESVIGRPQITSSWTSSESKCRVAVCVGVLRNSTFIP